MQVYFLFLESLGTPELILIALVALIVFGPRKLPGIGRTIGKYTAEFKRASREFRETFEREVEMAEIEDKQTAKSVGSEINPDAFNAVENTIGRNSMKRSVSDEEDFAALNENSSVALPEIRAINSDDFAPNSNESEAVEAEIVETTELAPRSKREWL